MTRKGIMDFYSKNHTKYICTLYGKSAEDTNVYLGGVTESTWYVGQ
jgi:hypothetical protein